MHAEKKVEPSGRLLGTIDVPRPKHRGSKDETRRGTEPVSRHYRVLFESRGVFPGWPTASCSPEFVDQEGDTGELAFAVLVERHASAVMRVCRRGRAQWDDAEDAFQATFLILATKAGSLRVRESLGPWLSAVAGRVARGACGGLARAARRYVRPSWRAARAGSDCSADTSSIVYEELDRLPARTGCAFALRHGRLYAPGSRPATGVAAGNGEKPAGASRGAAPCQAGSPGPLGSITLGRTVRPGSFRDLRGPDPIYRARGRRFAWRRIRPGGSAAVAALVTNSLRATIVNRLTGLIGVVLLISVGVAASVLCRGNPRRKRTARDSVPASAEQWSAPVFEYRFASGKTEGARRR